MANFRCWLYINHERNGWKESYYLSGVTHTQALTKLQVLAVARVDTLGAPCQIVRCLVTTEPPYRNYLASAGPGNLSRDRSVPIHTALLLWVHCGVNGKYHRTILLRGLPAAWFKYATLKKMILTAQGKDNLATYINTLIQNGWCLKVNSKETREYPIVAVGPTIEEEIEFMDTGYLTITTQGKHDITVFDGQGNPTRATVAGVHWFPAQPPGNKVNGNWQVLAVDDNEVALKADAPTQGFYTGGGVIQGRTSIFQPITGGVPLRMVQKDTGRALPFEGELATGPLPVIIPPGEAPPEEKGKNPQPSVAGPVPTSPTGQINNAHDFCVLIFEGYPEQSPSVASAKVLNADNTYLMAVPGTNADVSADWFSAIAEGFNQPLSYRQEVLAAIKANIPAGSELLVAGHSQGGMVMQNIAQMLNLNGYTVNLIMTFGSPPTTEAVKGVTYKMFIAHGDAVPFATPKAGLGQPGTYFSLGLPGPIPIGPYDGFFNPVKAHNSYPRLEQLLTFDATGDSIIPGKTAAVLRLGPIKRFQLPAAPPARHAPRV